MFSLSWHNTEAEKFKIVPYYIYNKTIKPDFKCSLKIY